jgi:hypothetical protein
VAHVLSQSLLYCFMCKQTFARTLLPLLRFLLAKFGENVLRNEVPHARTLQPLLRFLLASYFSGYCSYTATFVKVSAGELPEWVLSMVLATQGGGDY